ncbi:MAG TPA: protein-L-isoaspartate(D-aspartate) O-methyltransferase [Deltaproteobacteria bacterium]|nr:protein-L-isoaspartate(D-aspartate) O-methyltransferase [Deltaproteobacteria bacterium]
MTKTRFVLMVVVVLSAGLSGTLSLASDVPSLRSAMVKDQIRSRGIDDPATLKAMGAVERHLFVPESLRSSAYRDRPLPIGHGQTISQPYIVAYMTSVIQPREDFTVLEIGTGSGYQAAVLSEIVKRVYTVEIIPELAESATKRLQGLGYANVSVSRNDGYFGWKEYAPYDAIVVTAAADFIPPPLIEQLKDGGRMIIPVGSPFMVQTLTLVEKQGDTITTTALMPVRFVPFRRGN